MKLEKNSREKTICFFSHETKDSLLREQYSLQDISILRETGLPIIISTTFKEIPWNCSLYFSWWAAGSILPLIKAKLCGKPIIVIAGGNETMFYHDSVTGMPGGYLQAPWYKKIAARITLRYADRVLVVSDFMINDALKLGATNLRLVYNSINTDSFRLSDQKGTFVLSIFNLDENVVKLKRGDVFIYAIPSVLKVFPEITFIIIGRKGDAFNRLKKVVDNLGITKNVQFIGTVENKEVETWMHRSKVYVQISDTETFGVGIAEAMSCGIPVVVSKRGAIPQIVGDCGTYVDHNDPESVAFGIIDILKKSDNELRELGNMSRNRIVSNFSYVKRRNSIFGILKEFDIIGS